MHLSPEPITIANEELLPLLDALCALLDSEGAADAGEFFARIKRGVAASREAEDLAGPFLELATSAFHGFELSPGATFLIDRVLACAQELAHTFSAPSDPMH